MSCHGNTPLWVQYKNILNSLERLRPIQIYQQDVEDEEKEVVDVDTTTTTATRSKCAECYTAEAQRHLGLHACCGGGVMEYCSVHLVLPRDP